MIQFGVILSHAFSSHCMIYAALVSQYGPPVARNTPKCPRQPAILGDPSCTNYLKHPEGSIQNLCHWMRRGIAAGVYTQTTDVECEVNGLLSYDRAWLHVATPEVNFWGA